MADKGLAELRGWSGLLTQIGSELGARSERGAALFVAAGAFAIAAEIRELALEAYGHPITDRVNENGV